MDDSVIDKYHRQKIVDEMSGVIKDVRKNLEDHDHGKIVKTVPIRPEWAKMDDEVIALKQPLVDAIKKFESKMKLMWATIENDLEDYRSMHINREKNEIEIYDGETDE